MENNKSFFVVTNIEIEKKNKNICIEERIVETDNYDFNYRKTLVDHGYTEVYISDNYYCLNNGSTIKCNHISYEEEIGFDEDYDCICDKSLAIAIYNKIKNSHPSISDELILKYMNAALYNIRTKEKTEEVKKKRIKRLGLHPEFNNWSINSVIHYK